LSCPSRRRVRCRRLYIGAFPSDQVEGGQIGEPEAGVRDRRNQSPSTNGLARLRIGEGSFEGGAQILEHFFGYSLSGAFRDTTRFAFEARGQRDALT